MYGYLSINFVVRVPISFHLYANASRMDSETLSLEDGEFCNLSRTIDRQRELKVDYVKGCSDVVKYYF